VLNSGGTTSSNSSPINAGFDHGGHPAQPQRRTNRLAVLTAHGSGIKTTDTFTVGDEWDLVWSYSCASFGSSGNFIVNISAKGQHLTSLAGVNELGARGDGTEHYHEGGTFYFEVNSECDWTIKAVDKS
jgi:hypothetical protein